VVGTDDDVCVDFWADVCGIVYCGLLAEVEVLTDGYWERRVLDGVVVWRWLGRGLAWVIGVTYISF
jgi:hypothetical protein